MTSMSTHGLAQRLETISKALRELPDQSLVALLRQLQIFSHDRPVRQQAKAATVILPPPRDPHLMDRVELKEYLSSSKYFPRKTDLLIFARRYKVPVNVRTPREEIVRLCLRMIHDIPRGLNVLRFLAEQHEPLVSPSRWVLH